MGETGKIIKSIGVKMKNHINPQVIEANRLARKLRANGSPSEGENAFRLWEICSSNNIGYLTAKFIYIKAGYIPFRGYPLEKQHN